MNVMELYYDRVRRALRSTPDDVSSEVASSKASKSGRGRKTKSTTAPMTVKSQGVPRYAGLVRAQHRQSLMTMFEPLATRVGTKRFERLVDGVREHAPPRDPNPSRWATVFADYVGRQKDIDEYAKALTEYLALRIGVNIAPSVEWPGGIRPHAELRAFPCDPRAALKEGKKLESTPPRVMAIFRDDDCRVRVEELDHEAVAVWGLETGETTAEELGRAGVDASALARGRARLLELDLLRQSSRAVL